MGEKIKNNMHKCFSILKQEELNSLVEKYEILADLNPTLPAPNTPINELVSLDRFPLYTCMIEIANCRIPFNHFLMKVLTHYHVNISQCSPLGIAKIIHGEVSCQAVDKVPALSVFRKMFHVTVAGDWYTFEQRRGVKGSCFSKAPSHLKKWANHFFMLDTQCLPIEMQWRPPHPKLKDFVPDENQVDKALFEQLAAMPHPVRKYPEAIIIIVWISRNWNHTNKWSSLSYKGKGK